MTTIHVFVALGMLPQPTILVTINYGNNPCFHGIRHFATNATLVALSYGNKYFSRRNRKLQHTSFGGDNYVSQRVECL